MCRIVLASRIVFQLAVWDIDISISFSIGEFSKSANNEGIPGVEIFAFGLEVGDELGPLLLDGQLVVDVGVVGVDEFKIVGGLQGFDGIEDGGGIGFGLECTGPELVAFYALPAD